MPRDTTAIAIDTAFRTALLLGGTTRTAEAAVLDGIDACAELSPHGLLIETAKSTIRRRIEWPHAPDASNCFLLN